MSAELRHIDGSFVRNAAGISGVELFWGFGLPVVMESTFLQLLLRNFGASSLIIGLLPTMFSVGAAVFSLASAYLTVKLVRRRRSVMLVHFIVCVPLGSLGVVFLVAGEAPSILPVFLAGYGAFCLCLGLLMPVWQDYVVRIFSDKRVIPAMAVMMSLQSLGRLVGSYAILRVVESYAFSTESSGIVFILVSLSFAVGTLFFLLTREVHSDSTAQSAANHSRGRAFAGALARALRNRQFLQLMGTDLEYFALLGVISFYAVFATEHRGVSQAFAAGMFVAASYVGMFGANLLFGWFDLLSVKAKYLLTKGMALASIPLICFVGRPWAFLVASFLIGVSRGTRALCYGPAVRRVAGQRDATTYFALAPIVTLPLSAGIPLLNGAVLDRLSPMGADSYRIVFLAMGAVMLLGLCFVPWLRIPEPPTGGEAVAP